MTNNYEHTLQILAVDDTPANLKLLTDILKSRGYQVRPASSGRLALRSVAVEAPDLILLDVRMPEMDGYEVCRCLKSDEKSRLIPIIFISALDDLADKIKGFDAGAVDFITKPFEEAEVLARVGTHLALRRLQKEAEERNSQLEAAYEELKTAGAKLLQQEKMASIGQLAAGVAHEINNPLGFITSNIKTLEKYVDGYIQFIDAQSATIKAFPVNESINELEDIKMKLKLDYILEDSIPLIKETLEGADRIIHIIQNLMKFSSICDTDNRLSNINDSLESSVCIVCNDLKKVIAIKTEYGSIPETVCNIGQLNLAFANVLLNAVQSIDNAGEIVIKTWYEEDKICISISDTGCGIPDSIISRIYDPFYTTKAVGEGPGLGLSIVYDIIKKHKGDIQVESEIGKGTKFIFQIPVL